MLTVKQFAEKIKKSPRWVQLQIKLGKLPAQKVEKTRYYYLIEESELERLKETK